MASWIRKKIRGTAPSRDAVTLGADQHREERATTLIPSSSDEALVSKPQLSSKFFTCLSAELRIAILTAAFGHRIVHIFYHDERAKQPKGHPRSIRRGKKTAKQDCEPARVSSAVCCRSRYAQDLLSLPTMFDDRCYGVLETDDSWPAELLAKIRIGALGWLVSCRQAYIEGTDILYSTNTFHINSLTLSAQLPNFIPLQCLATIRSIEFVWSWGNMRAQGGEGAFERQLTSMLGNIPKELQRLSSLKIVFQDSLSPMSCFHGPSPVSFKLWMEAKVLGPLDAVVRGWEVLKECEVYFAASVHQYLVRGMGFEMEVKGEGRFWRGAGVDSGRGEKQEKGYWVCEGRDDMRTMPGCVLPTGAREK